MVPAKSPEGAQRGANKDYVQVRDPKSGKLIAVSVGVARSLGSDGTIIPSTASLDDDGDRTITRTEASARTQSLVDFDRIDLDLDNKLEPAEYALFYSAGYRASK
jgi:hypothetical protein